MSELKPRWHPSVVAMANAMQEKLFKCIFSHKWLYSRPIEGKWYRECQRCGKRMYATCGATGWHNGRDI